ncbi:MAG: DUF4149 domain-containing protein [Burkholderiales bacterium]|jgi:hypothetical protein|nr:DUF4149 domain-containing protein [Burkholderiales bacterium]
MAAVDRLLAGVREIALVAWVGSLWLAGGVVAPLLFRSLSDRRQAGDIAGALFEAVTWIGFAAAAVVLALQGRRSTPRRLGRIGTGCALAMVALSAVGHFGVRPVLVDLRMRAAGQPVMAGELATRFGRWHAVSGSLYLASVVLGAALVVSPRRPEGA